MEPFHWMEWALTIMPILHLLCKGFQHANPPLTSPLCKEGLLADALTIWSGRGLSEGGSKCKLAPTNVDSGIARKINDYGVKCAKRKGRGLISRPSLISIIYNLFNLI